MTVETVGRVEPLGRMGLLALDASASSVEPMQPYLEVDTETGELLIDLLHQSDSMVPMRVWHGLNRRFDIAPHVNAALLTESINAGEIDGLVQRICTGTETVWDGSNHVARSDDDAAAASEELQAWLDGADELNGDAPGLWDAGEYHADSTDADLGITEATTDAELEQIAERLEREAEETDTLLAGTLEYLTERRDALRDA